MRFRVWLTMQSSFAIARSRATGNQLETLRHIPGTAWRGALAAHLISERTLKDKAHLDSDFAALFLSNRVRFGDLRHNGYHPFPLSGRVCSRHHHRMLDLLLCRALGENPRRTCGAPTAHGKCEAKIVPREGTVRIREAMVESNDPLVRVTAHTAIANESLRVREGQLHTSTIVERRQTFQGDAIAQDEDAAMLLEKICSEITEITIGRGSTRGQGIGELKTERLPTGAREQEIEGRLRMLNLHFRQTGKLAFTVSFYSPCIVYDDWNRSRPYLTAEDLSEAAGEPASAFSSYRLADWFSRLVVIQGWNAQSGLPKADMVAIAPGSAFLFIGEVSEAQYDAEIARLAVLLGRCSAGIGERWDEGYGESTVCDPVHFGRTDCERL